MALPLAPGGSGFARHGSYERETADYALVLLPGSPNLQPTPNFLAAVPASSLTSQAVEPKPDLLAFLQSP